MGVTPSPTPQSLDEQLSTFFHYLLTEPCQDTVDMDCNDCCEYLSQLAEQVAAGTSLRELMPDLAEHLHCYPCVKEEFQALITVLRAEQEGKLGT